MSEQTKNTTPRKDTESYRYLKDNNTESIEISINEVFLS